MKVGAHLVHLAKNWSLEDKIQAAIRVDDGSGPSTSNAAAIAALEPARLPREGQEDVAGSRQGTPTASTSSQDHDDRHLVEAEVEVADFFKVSGHPAALLVP